MKLKIKGKEYEVKPFICTKNLNNGKTENPDEIKIPFYINVTNACNAKCEFCSNSLKDNKELNYKELEEILDQIHDKIYRFAISGGETLIDSKRLEKVLDIVDKYNIKITLNTNGYFLKNNIDLLNKYNNIQSVQLSRHHYDDKLNDEVFKINTLPLKEIRDIDKKLKADLNINCLLIKGYIDSLDKVYDYLEVLSTETEIKDIGFISMMQVNKYTKDNFIDYKKFKKEIEENGSINYKGRTFYLERNTMEAGFFSDGKRCSCANYIYVTKNKKTIHFYFRYTEKYGHCGKRSLFYDCNGLQEGY